jgi:UDP-2,4-diacetamido-2,4,6-trideoxy-beta-L-altropyranose hydrolase
MKQKVVFRADGNSSIGLGHLLRLVALADMLKNDILVCFAIQKPTKSVIALIQNTCSEIISLPEETDYLKEANSLIHNHLDGNEIVVLDGYHFKSEYQKLLATKCKKLVYVDDLHSWHQHAHCIINHALGVSPKDYSAESYTQFYLGLNYALLRKEFFNFKFAKRNVKQIKKVFVSMGGTDIHNVTLKVIEALSTINFIENITVLVGSVNVRHTSVQNYLSSNSLTKFNLKQNLSAQELCDELNSCDLAICPASTTAIEACAIGIGLICGTTASNQNDILRGLDQNNCILNAGDLTQLSVQQIRALVMDLSENTEPLVKMMLAQKELIDGKSPQRFVELFKKLQDA